jgi:hypothetical protein
VTCQESEFDIRRDLLLTALVWALIVGKLVPLLKPAFPDPVTSGMDSGQGMPSLVSNFQRRAFSLPVGRPVYWPIYWPVYRSVDRAA